MTKTATTHVLNKKIILFYAVELISAIAFTYFQAFSGLIWLAVAISFIGIIPKLPPLSEKISDNIIKLISQTCLILSSVLWGYIMLYSLTSAPVIYTTILIARVLATLIAFKEIRDHIIVIVPLLIAFALLKPAGCVPPISF